MDEETRGRLEALEMVAVTLLADRYDREELGRLAARADDCMQLRRRVAPFPPGFEWSDGAWRWHRRLLQLARDLQDQA